jgi:hypothetical protein
MPWALVDVGFHDHPKVLALLDEPDALAAIGLWTMCLAWAKGHTDPDTPASAGRVPASLVRRLGGCELQAKLLVKAGLWEAADDGGWVIHEFASWQQLEAWRVKREQGRKGGRPRKPRSEPSDNHVVHRTETISQSHVMTGHGTTGKVEVVEPTVGPHEKTSRGKNDRASRLPAEFKPTMEMVAWARKEVPHVDGRLETQKFIDHWTAASGATARKLDWVAAWRNWMRKADEQLGRGNGYRPPGKPGTLDDGFWER